MSANAPFTTAHLWMVVALVMGATLASEAQTVGTFRWQLRTFCNVVTVAITQNGAVYRLEGTVDQCGGGPDAASVTRTPRAERSLFRP